MICNTSSNLTLPVPAALNIKSVLLDVVSILVSFILICCNSVLSLKKNAAGLPSIVNSIALTALPPSVSCTATYESSF